MPFPLVVGSRTFEDAPELALAVAADARAGGGTVIPGEAPSMWVAGLVADGRLEPYLAVGLAAGMLRTTQPPLIAEGARLAARLGETQLAPLLPHALDAHDVGVLLSQDPVIPGRSVEETLLRAWADLAPVHDPVTRADLLARLRRASLGDVELAVLVRHGTADEIRRLLPDVLVEGLPAGGPAALADGVARGGDVADALREIAGALLPAPVH